ncbi:hypothetical protein D3C85_1624420 [compost metagenome]
MVDIDQARIAAQPGQQAVDTFTGSRHGAVDAFFGQQQGAFDAILFHGLEQRFAQLDVIFQGDELVQRRHDDSLGHAVNLQVVTLAKGGPDGKKNAPTSGALHILAKT